MKILFFIGGSLIGISVFGKTLFKLARLIRKKTQFVQCDVGKYYKGGFDSTMTKREAILILGVKSNYNKNDLKEAHRKLIMLNHPDNGGSTYIASKINEAKEMLNSSVKV